MGVTGLAGIKVSHIDTQASVFAGQTLKTVIPPTTWTISQNLTLGEGKSWSLVPTTGGVCLPGSFHTVLTVHQTVSQERPELSR